MNQITNRHNKGRIFLTHSIQSLTDLKNVVLEFMAKKKNQKSNEQINEIKDDIKEQLESEKNTFDEQTLDEFPEEKIEEIPIEQSYKQTIVPMIPKVDKSIKSANFDQKIQELKDTFNPTLPTKAYLDYYIDFEHKMYETVRLNEIPQAIELGSEEAQILKSSCEIRDGIPVFKIGRGYPISVDMVANTERNTLIEQTMSSFQLLAWLKDTHITYLTKPRKDNSNPIFTNILLIIGTLFITLFFSYLAWGG